MLLQFTAEDFLVMGLKGMGFSQRSIDNNSETTNLIRFKGCYYASPMTCYNLFIDIQSDICDKKISKPKPLYVLLALYYLKKYPTKSEMAAFIDGCENTALRQTKRYLKAIQGLKKHKVK